MTEERLSKFYLLSTSLLLFTLPFYLHIGIYAFTLWGISGALFFIRVREFRPSKIELYLLIFSSLFIISQLISSIISENQTQGFKHLSAMLPILFTPIFLIFGKNIISTNKSIFLKSFVGGYILASFIIIGLALFNKFIQHSDKLYYGDISVFQHPTYASMGANGAIAILLYVLTSVKNSTKMQKFGVGFSILILTASVYLLSSRISLISLFFVFLIWIISVIFDRRYKLKFRLLIPILLLIPIFAVLQNERFIKNIFEIKAFFDNSSETSTRILLWETAYNIGNENIVLGCGNGDVDTEIYSRYNNPKKLNAHNQFLEIYAGSGISGFIPFILLIFLPLLSAMSVKSHLVFSLLLIVIITMFVETILLRFTGAILFSMFTFFIVIISNSKNK